MLICRPRISAAMGVITAPLLWQGSLGP